MPTILNTKERSMFAVDLKAQLGSLLKLQVVDSEIYKLKMEKNAIPQGIKLLEAAFEEKKQHLAGLEKRSLDLQKQRKDKELELGAKEDEAKKLQGQLSSLKTNKEYQTMLQEIAGKKADGSVIEDSILQVLEQLDQAKKDVEAEKQRLQGQEKEFLEEKKKVEIRAKEIDDRLAQLEAHRKQLSPGIDPKVMAQYERILSNRDGLAIVAVKDNACQGCNMSIPRQVTNSIKMYECIMTCDVCNRMLYTEE